jgi:ribosomal protein S27E
MKPATFEIPRTIVYDQRDLSWDCAFCGRLRVCPFATPYPRGSTSLESCRICGDMFVDIDDERAAVVRAISQHLL